MHYLLGYTGAKHKLKINKAPKTEVKFLGPQGLSPVSYPFSLQRCTVSAAGLPEERGLLTTS